MDPVLLSRMQFAWVIAWHILLPAFTVGLSAYVAFLEVLHFATGRRAFLVLANFAAIRRYNPSDFYALAVGLLGDTVVA